MGAVMEHTEAQPGRGWDDGCGGANAVLCLSVARASLSVCYHQEFGPHDELILLQAAADLLPDLLQVRWTHRAAMEACELGKRLPDLKELEAPPSRTMGEVRKVLNLLRAQR